MPLLLCFLTFAAAAKRDQAPTPITVLYFDNNSGDASYDALGKGLADMMITDLANLPSVRVVEREKLQALLTELKLQRSKYFDPKTARQIGMGVGAQFAVTGSFAALDPDVRIDVRVIGISNGQVVKANKVVGNKASFFALQEQLSKVLTEELGEALGRKDVNVTLSGGTDKLASARAYGASLDDQDSGNLKQASDELQHIVASDPGFVLAKSHYMQIMRELYAAKSGRFAALTKIETDLLETINPMAEAMFDPKDDNDTIYGRLPRTIVRGDIYLKRVADALAQPASAYTPDLQRYLDNTIRLIEAIDLRDIRGENNHRMMTYQCPGDGFACLSEEERRYMAQLGLHSPLDFPQRTQIHQLALDAANVMMHGEAPAFAGWKFPKRVCFYELDKNYPKRAFELYDLGEKTLTQYEDYYESWPAEIPNQGATIALWRAKSYERIGKIEEAIAALQAAMKRYPTAKDFPLLEQNMRDLINGKPVISKCEEPR